MGSVLSSPSATASSLTNNDGACGMSDYHHEELIMMNSSYDVYNTTDTRMTDRNSRETASSVVATQPQTFTSTMAGVIVVSSLTTLLPISATIGYLYWVRSQQLRQYNKQLTQSLIETHNGRRMEHSKRIRAERELKSTIQQCQTVLDQRRHERKRSSKRERTNSDDEDDSKCSTPKQQQQQQIKATTTKAKLEKRRPSLPQLQDQTITPDHHHYDERIAISPKLSRSLSEQGEDEIEVELIVDEEEVSSTACAQHERDDHEDVLATRQSFSYEEDFTSSVGSRRFSSKSYRRRSTYNDLQSTTSSSLQEEEEGLILGEETRFLAPPSPPSSTSTSMHSRSSSIHSRSSSIVSTSSMRSHSRSLSVSSNWSTATVASEYMMPTQDKVVVPYVPYEMKSLEDQEETAVDHKSTKISESYSIESSMMNTVESPEQVTPIHKNKVHDDATPDLIQISTVSTELPTTSFDSTGTSLSVSTAEPKQERTKHGSLISPPSLSVARQWKNETIAVGEDNKKKTTKISTKKNLAEQLEHPYMNNTARFNKKAEIRNKLVGRIRKNVTEKLAEQTTKGKALEAATKGKGLELSLSPTTVFRTPMVRRKTQHYANIQDMEYM